MRTTLDIPEALLDEVQQVAGVSTRREAVIVALDDFLRRQRMKRVLAAAGTLELDVDARAIRTTGNRRTRGE